MSSFSSASIRTQNRSGYCLRHISNLGFGSHLGAPEVDPVKKTKLEALLLRVKQTNSIKAVKHMSRLVYKHYIVTEITAGATSGRAFRSCLMNIDLQFGHCPHPVKSILRVMLRVIQFKDIYIYIKLLQSGGSAQSTLALRPPTLVKVTTIHVPNTF